MHILLFFLLGLLLGSFLNVLVIRLAEGEDFVSGRSRCPRCQSLIAWYDNIPLWSYLVLGGRCRSCKGRISWQYPLAEFVTGVLFAAAGFLYAGQLDAKGALFLAWMLFLISLLIAVTLYDLRFMEIPVPFLLAGNIGTMLFLLAQYFLSERGVPFWQTELVAGLLGSLAVTLFFYGLVFFSKETWMGWGDVWLGMLAGLAAGHLAFVMLTISFAIGAIVGCALLALGKKGLQAQVPFAPFLASGLLLTLFLESAWPALFRFLVW